MELEGQPGILQATIHVTRKDTGKVETYYLTGAATPEQAAALMGRHHGASGAMVGEGAKLTNEEK